MIAGVFEYPAKLLAWFYSFTHNYIIAISLIAFVVIETKVASSPIAPLGLLRTRALAGANIAMACVGGSMFAMWYFVSLYLQEVLHLSPLQAGVGFIPAALVIIVGAQVAGRVMPRTGPMPILAVAGVVIDRFDRRTIMITADLVRGVVVLGLLFVRTPGTVWIAYAVLAVAVSATGFFEPSKSATMKGVHQMPRFMFQPRSFRQRNVPSFSSKHSRAPRSTLLG